MNEGLDAAVQGEHGYDLFFAELLRIKGEILLRHEGVRARKTRSVRRLTLPSSRKHCSGSCAPPTASHGCAWLKVAVTRHGGFSHGCTIASPRALKRPICVRRNRFWTNFSSTGSGDKARHTGLHNRVEPDSGGDTVPNRLHGVFRQGRCLEVLEDMAGFG